MEAEGIADMTDSIPELAAQLDPSDAVPAMSMRVGIVTAVEVGGSRRVQVDIAGATWLNRLQDTQIQINDRVSVLQQGPVMIAIGRLQGTDGFTPIGVMMPWTGFFIPNNWLLCEGAAVSRATYSSLFFTCGTNFGAGNGTTTFNLPDMRNRVILGGSLSHIPYTTGDGNFTLLSTHMPNHSHSVPAGGAAAVFAGAGGDFAANDDPGTSGTAGSGTPFVHLPPFLALQYIIRAL